MQNEELFKSLSYTLPEGTRREDLLLRAGSSSIEDIAKVPDETTLGVRYDEKTKSFTNDDRLFVPPPSFVDVSPWAIASSRPPSSFFYRDALQHRHAFSFSGNQDKFTARLRLEESELIVENINEEQEVGNVIVKPWSGRYRFLPENEFFCMMLLSEMGFRVAESRLLQTNDGRFHFIVNRFDIERNPETGKNERIRTFQLAELMELPTDENGKYSITTEELMDFVDAHLVDFEKFVLSYIAGWAIGNGDMHAKNFSVYSDSDGRYHMTPLYDMLNTTVYENMIDRLALPFGECCHPSPKGEDFLGFFAERYGEEFIKRCITTLSRGSRKMNFLLEKMISLDSDNQRRTIFMEFLTQQTYRSIQDALRDAKQVLEQIQTRQQNDAMIEFER